MASYFNLTLDTLAPEGLTLAINDGALYTTSVTVKLTVGLTDEATSGYQMKIWGIDGVAEEAAASWETYAATKSVTLTEGDGLKTVFIKVRDDVGNETGAVSDTITLNTAVPVVRLGVSIVSSMMYCGSSAGAKHMKDTTTSPVPVLSAVPVLPPIR